MISGKYRFHSRGGVNYVYKKGQTYRTKDISAVVHPNRQTRIAVVVSKKVLKPAVGRNRIRRRVYEVVRQYIPEFKRPTDIIFIIHHKEIKNTPSQELDQAINTLLKNAKII